MDAIERRVAWMAITLGLALLFAGRGGPTFGPRLGGWLLFFNLVVFIALGVAVALLVAALVPASLRPMPLEQRERFAFYAFALWGIAMLVLLGLSIDAFVDAYRNPVS